MTRCGTALVGILVVCTSLAVGQSATTQPAADAPTPTSAPTTQPGLFPRVLLETTGGALTLELNGEVAPISTLNFLKYVETGYYDGLIFHRVKRGALVQGGGYTPELDRRTAGLQPPIFNEWDNGLRHLRGAVAMAYPRGDPNAATSEFYINVVDNIGGIDAESGRQRPDFGQPKEGAADAVFGRVLDGMDVVDALNAAELQEGNPKYPYERRVVPESPVTILKARVLGAYDADAIKAQIDVCAKRRAATEARMNAEAERQIDAYVSKLEERLGRAFTRLPSGVRYVILESGDPKLRPNPEGLVGFHYTGQLLDGNVFQSTRARGQPLIQPVKQLIAGWQEVLPLIGVGGRAVVVVPPQRAFGKAGRPPLIPAYAPMACDIEVTSVAATVPQADVEIPAQAPPAP